MTDLPGTTYMTGNIWDQVLSRIETKVNRHSFYTWFKPTSFVADDGRAIRVRVPNTLFRDWLTKHYSAVLQEALGEVERRDASVAFVTDDLPPVPTPLPDPLPITPDPSEDPDAQPGGLAPRCTIASTVALACSLHQWGLPPLRDGTRP